MKEAKVTDPKDQSPDRQKKVHCTKEIMYF